MGLQENIKIDQDLVKQLIESQCHLKVQELELLNTLVCAEFLVNSEYIFRFARQKAHLQNEIKFMPMLRSRLDFITPQVQWVGEPSRQYPFYFVGSRKSSYQTLTELPLWSCQSLEFGQELGLALKQLHQVRTKKSGTQSPRTPSFLRFSERLSRCENLWRKYEAQFEEAGFPTVVLREVFMSYENLEAGHELVPVHGNLYSRQVLLDAEMNFIGLQDWGNMQMGDRGLDLALAWMIFEEPVAKAFFDAYGPVKEVQFEISLFQALYHSMVMLPYAFRAKDENLKQWTIFSLRKSIGL